MITLASQVNLIIEGIFIALGLTDTGRTNTILSVVFCPAYLLVRFVISGFR